MCTENRTLSAQANSDQAAGNGYGRESGQPATPVEAATTARGEKDGEMPLTEMPAEKSHLRKIRLGQRTRQAKGLPGPKHMNGRDRLHSGTSRQLSRKSKQNGLQRPRKTWRHEAPCGKSLRHMQKRYARCLDRATQSAISRMLRRFVVHISRRQQSKDTCRPSKGSMQKKEQQKKKQSSGRALPGTVLRQQKLLEKRQRPRSPQTGTPPPRPLGHVHSIPRVLTKASRRRASRSCIHPVTSRGFPTLWQTHGNHLHQNCLTLPNRPATVQ